MLCLASEFIRALRSFRWPLLLASLLGTVTACTRSSIPIPTQQVTRSVPTETPRPPEPTEPVVEEGPTEYAVVWVGADEALKVRETAGITGTVVAELFPTQIGLERTGNTTQLGSSTWIEVRTPSGQAGWVRSWNVTEYVPEDNFCRDGRVLELLEGLEGAVADGDGQALEEIISPNRGLVVRLDPWNPEVLIDQDEAARVFTDPTARDWGTRFAGETLIRGTFAELVAASLIQTLAEGDAPRCNELALGPQGTERSWPIEYANINFYSFLLGPDVTGNPNDWRTWVVGVEYVDGRPYLALLMQFRPQA